MGVCGNILQSSGDDFLSESRRSTRYTIFFSRRKKQWKKRRVSREVLQKTTYDVLSKTMGTDLANLILKMTFPFNGWHQVSKTVEQVDEWRIRASGMPANGILEPIQVGQSITFRLVKQGAFNWVIGAMTHIQDWNYEEYLIKGRSHVFLTRSKFSLNGDFTVAKNPSRDLANSDTVTLSRANGKLLWHILNEEESFGEVYVDDDREVVPVIGLSTNGVCEIVELKS